MSPVIKSRNFLQSIADLCSLVLPGDLGTMGFLELPFSLRIYHVGLPSFFLNACIDLLEFLEVSLKFARERLPEGLVGQFKAYHALCEKLVMAHSESDHF